jgi:hypothetical protein
VTPQDLGDMYEAALRERDGWKKRAEMYGRLADDRMLRCPFGLHAPPTELRDVIDDLWAALDTLVAERDALNARSLAMVRSRKLAWVLLNDAIEATGEDEETLCSDEFGPGVHWVRIVSARAALGEETQ